MPNPLTFQEVVEKTVTVIRAFEKVEQKPWGIEGAMIELAKQLGDLAKQVMTYEKYYLAGRESLPEYQASKEKIGDELADLLFMTIRIAEHYKIDLEKEHLKALDDAMKHPLMNSQ